MQSHGRSWHIHDVQSHPPAALVGKPGARVARVNATAVEVEAVDQLLIRLSKSAASV